MNRRNRDSSEKVRKSLQRSIAKIDQLIQRRRQEMNDTEKLLDRAINEESSKAIYLAERLAKQERGIASFELQKEFVTCHLHFLDGAKSMRKLAETSQQTAEVLQDEPAHSDKVSELLSKATAVYESLEIRIEQISKELNTQLDQQYDTQIQRRASEFLVEAKARSRNRGGTKEKGSVNERYPLRGTQIQYVDPLGSVADGDWEASR